MAATHRQFGVFLMVGGLSTAAQYALLTSLVHLAGVAPVPASVCGYALGAIVNYVLNYQFTFRSSASHGVALLRFIAMAGAGMGLNTGIVWTAVHPLGINYLVAQVFATGVVLVFNFTVGKLWTFRSPAEAATAAP